MTTEEIWKQLYEDDHSIGVLVAYNIECAKTNSPVETISIVRKEELSQYVRSIRNNLQNESEKREKDTDIQINNNHLGYTICRYLREHGINRMSQIIELSPKGTWEFIFREKDRKVLPKYLFDMVKAVDNTSSIEYEKMQELYDFIDSVRGYKMTRSGETTEKKAIHELLTLPNIGVGMLSKLQYIGIDTIAQFMQRDTKELWKELFTQYPTIDIQEIYMIEGAKLGIKMSNLSQEIKKELKLFVIEQKSK